MDIKGLDKLNGLKSLNRRIYKDETGWRFEVYNLPEGVSSHEYIRMGCKRVPELIVVDLAMENNLKTANEVRDLYDNVMDLFFARKLGVALNGIESICEEIDTREFNLKLSSYQMEILRQGLFSVGNFYTNDTWDREDKQNAEYFSLLDKFHVTRHEKKELEETLKERRDEKLIRP